MALPKAEITAECRISKARIKLLMQQPFFGTLALRLRMIEADPRIIPTMATDGNHIFYSSKFVDSITDAQLRGVVAHEVMHPALQHLSRIRSRNLPIWNMACDYAINPILIGAGLELPQGALIDSDRFPPEMSADEIYQILYAEARQQAQNAPGMAGDGDGSSESGETAGESQDASGSGQAKPGSSAVETPGGFGQMLDPTSVDPSTGQVKAASPADLAAAADEWRIAAEQAARVAKNRGRLPANLERLVHEAKQEQIDWREQLRRFVSTVTPNDYSWSRPNRRHIAAGLYLPGMVKDGIGEIVVAVDTSGSIGNHELSAFSAEIAAICRECNPERVYVVYCDAAVACVEEFAAGDDVRLTPHGGGGTDFRPPFAWVEQQGIDPQCLIYLTDLCCDSYPKEPHYPAMWVSTYARMAAPWGETLYLRPELCR